MSEQSGYIKNKIVIFQSGEMYKVIANNVSEYLANNEKEMHSIVSWLKMQQQCTVTK